MRKCPTICCDEQPESLNTYLVIKSFFFCGACRSLTSSCGSDGITWSVTDEYHDKDIMNTKLLAARESQARWKTNSIVLQEVFNCVVVFEEQNLNHENILRENTGKIQPLQHRLEEENITHTIFKHHFRRETQTDLSSYLKTLCLLLTNTHHNETNIILKETLDMLCICKFDFIGIAVK